MAAIGVVLTLGMVPRTVPAQDGRNQDGRNPVLSELRVATDDYARGALDDAWFRFWILARNGHPAAQFNLGQLYRQGQGIPADLAQARYWYEAAAVQGYAYAQYNLAIMYEYGQGTAADAREALRWYQRAAAQNLDLAQRAVRRLEAKRAGRPEPGAQTAGAPPPVLAD